LKILLVDVDSTIPNIALGRLSTYWKARGASISFQQCKVPYHSTRPIPPITLDLQHFKKAYVSTIFKTSHESVGIINEQNTELIVGGSGVPDEIDPGPLPPEIAGCAVDYDLWPDNKTSYGFITRGCIRRCSFCEVHKREGNIRFESHPRDIIQHKTVKFLDNNFLAYPEHQAILWWLWKEKVLYQFNQGLDIRLLTEDAARIIGESRYKGDYIFAFDRMDDQKQIDRGLEIAKKYLPSYRCKFYLYVHPSMAPSNIIYRI
jgi:hypothetical protein